jgi:hypothetical protein
MEYRRVEGKTYTLFGESSSTEEFYKLVCLFAGELTEENPDQKILLKEVRNATKDQRHFNRWKASFPALSTKLEQLDVYTRNTNKHLKSLSILNLFDKRLRTKEWQYHLFMLEAELTNRMNKQLFLESEYKMALLPYCLHDLKKECKSSSDGIEYVCRSCSAECYINTITKTLKAYNVKGYLWMQSNLKTLFKGLAKDFKTIGILGIACIPELVSGMRSCEKHHIPAVGIPLDANRCIRWMGSFHENSVNLEQLNKLLTR